MMKTRIAYWNSSPIADFIRGEKKPFALEWNEWDSWHKKTSEKHPIRYWIAEKGFTKLQDIVYFPYDLYNTISIYTRNRWIDKTHVLNTGLKPGKYYEFDTKVLHGLFNELVDYVDGELAHTMKAYKDRNYKFINGRCKQAGLDHLEWACSLKYNEDYGLTIKDKDYGKLTPQALSAQKVRDLYEWWTITRPNRPDPHVVAKYDETIEESLFSGKKLSAKKRACLSKINKIEEQYDKEDTNKLIELIKIRKEIWT